MLASEAYKAYLRPLIVRSEKATLKRIRAARQGLVVSDGLEFVVVASGGKKHEEELDAEEEEEGTTAEPTARVQAVQQGKPLVVAAAERTQVSAQ